MYIPSSTYRIQFTGQFGFKDAEEIVPYLAKLGITDLYASPIFRATKDSTHGYDVTDHNQLNGQLGTESDFDSLCRSLKQHNIRWLQDIVPNHMAFDPGNGALMDLLRKGPQSQNYNMFDIKWHNPWPELQGKVLVPVLGQSLEETIAAGQIKLSLEDQTIFVNYYDKKFPLRQHHADIAGRLDHLNSPAGADELARLLDDQYFVLAFWKDAAVKLNYRPFFHLTDFIAINQQDRPTFQASHRLLLRMIEQGKIHSLRIDHVDGLYHPAQYLQSLAQAGNNPYVIVEKILEFREELPGNWPVEGTSGYQFMNYLNNIFIDQNAAQGLEEFYHEFTGRTIAYDDLLYYQKMQFIRDFMQPEFIYLAWKLENILRKNNIQWLEGARKMRHLLEQFVACLGVYRTYINPDQSPSDADRLQVAQAIEQAISRNPELVGELEMLGQVLTGQTDLIDPANWPELLDFVMQMQQYTGTVMAKGLEDTFMYVYNRFVSINEVGSSPDRFGITIERFHEYNIARSKKYPNAMNASSTHDTKRGEDVRARLNVLSEMPREWQEKVQLWHQLNKRFKKQVDDRHAPDNNKEYLLYQSLIGAYPWHRHDEQFVGRLRQYFQKALREANVSTSWVEPDNDYERASLDFVEKILRNDQFLDDFRPFQARIARLGVYNSLAQTLIKMTCPGVCDFYQGSELWNLSLVDPDNRRAVDFDRRSRYLEQMITADDAPAMAREVIENPQSGKAKLLLIHKLLQARQAHQELFRQGTYVPLNVTGPYRNNIIAFARKFNGKTLLTVAPRFLSSVIDDKQLPQGYGVWKSTAIDIERFQRKKWHDLLLGREIDADNTVSVARALEHFPCAALLST